jgi:TRAP-type C4-dicarboxylate transport system substrate-binding protein
VTRSNFAIARTVVMAAAAAVTLHGSHGPAFAVEQWNFYMHQSAPNFATSRGAKLFTEQVEKATNGELKIRLHLAGTDCGFDTSAGWGRVAEDVVWAKLASLRDGAHLASQRLFS